jgi:hypothetical protein
MLFSKSVGSKSHDGGGDATTGVGGGEVATTGVGGGDEVTGGGETAGVGGGGDWVGAGTLPRQPHLSAPKPPQSEAQNVKAVEHGTICSDAHDRPPSAMHVDAALHEPPAGVGGGGEATGVGGGGDTASEACSTSGSCRPP